MKTSQILRLLPAALLLGVAAAQNGANDCANATPIVGLGTYNFDNTGFTIDGPPDCSGQPVRRDMWYLWTCTASDGYSVSTCNGTTLETRIVIYDGFDCSGFPQITCAASTCGGQTEVTFNAISGNQYLIRLGSRAAGASGSGTFEIGQDFCVTAPNDQFDPNGDCSIPTAMVDGSWSALFVSKDEPDYYTFELAAGATLQMDLTFDHAAGDVDVFVYDDSGCTNVIADALSGDSNETLTYTNIDTCDQLLKVRIEVWTGSGSPCNSYDLSISGSGGAGNPCGGGGGGVTYVCDPANINSTGTDAKALVTGSLLATDPYPIHIDVNDGPPSQFGYFLGSATAVDPGINVSAGQLCVGAPQVRYGAPTATGEGNPDFKSVSVFDASGALQNLSGTSTTGMGFDVPNYIPGPISQQIAPGATWVFQLWYRDVGGLSNFSTAASVTFN